MSKKREVWLAVDKDGTEKMSNSGLIRRKYNNTVWFGMVSVHYTKNEWNKWGDGVCVNVEDNNPDVIPFWGVELPRGTIKKLLGRSMTWEEEPVLYNGTNK